MKEYQVIGRQATVRTGEVKLNDDQANSRSHHLKAVKGKKGFYSVTGPINFKFGENFFYDGEVNKLLAEEVGEVVDVKAEKAKEKKKKKQAEKDKTALSIAEAAVASEKERADNAEAAVTELETSLKTETEIKLAAQTDVTSALKKADDAEDKLEEAKILLDELEREVSDLKKAAKK